jgi:hypothetical protein
VKRALLALLAINIVACATTKPVDMNEPRRVVGTENAVRIDAEIIGEEVQNGAHVPITYSITNERQVPIAVADLIPTTSFDPETQTITVAIGSEVPGMATVPRLIVVEPGETKTFNTMARLVFALPRSSDAHRMAPVTDLRLLVNFLGDTSGDFQKLIGIPERAIADPELAESLFPLWLERNEVVFTNSVPMRWKGSGGGDQSGTPAPDHRTRPVT